MGKSEGRTGFRRAGGGSPRLTSLHVGFVLRTHVVAEGLFADSSLRCPNFRFIAQKPVLYSNGTDSCPYVSAGCERPLVCPPVRARAVMLRGPPASGRKRMRGSPGENVGVLVRSKKGVRNVRHS